VIDPLIHSEDAGDRQAVWQVNRAAFPTEAEANLVDALRDQAYVRLSLVAEVDGAVIGHILFSDLPIVGEGVTYPALALAPMSVLPKYQRQGIGAQLVRRALEICREHHHRIVVVLGHPHFYQRFGFSSELARHLQSPFSERDSFMALELVEGSLNGVSGEVRYPQPFGVD
jgi:putative acetyltransferase